jgi:predicted nuclease of predicted toxin-antitoxin system
VPSKRRSATSRKKKQLDRQPSFLIDRSLGRLQLLLQLHAAGIDVTAGDDVYDETERDPWIFYKCGKEGKIVLTADKDFMRSFPHMAAIALGKTTVIAFTSNNYNSAARGRAFIRAQSRIFRAINDSETNFIGSVGMDSTFVILERSPFPNRKYCDEKDWNSYERVCKAEGIDPNPRTSLAKSPSVPRGPSGPLEGEAGTETA